jgi:type II secretory pathway predicted ATPase ExeA
MAILHPDPPRLAPHLRSEGDVLRSLRMIPGAHLFVRLAILDPETNHDRELDFLVLHPELGLVIVEVKGKGVELRGGRWIRRYDDGTEKPLDETPGEQLQAQQWALLRWLQAETPGFIPQITRVLALPALALPEGQALGPDLPACRILTRAKLDHPLEALRAAVSGGADWAAWRTGRNAHLHEVRPDRMLELARALTPKLLPPAPLAQILEAEGRLQDEQSQILLDHLARNFAGGRFHVTGGPGSGKSLLARQTARLWAAEGRRVLVVAFNRALTYATQGALDDLIRENRAFVATYHDLAVTLLSGAERLPQGEGTPDFFNRALPEALAALLADPQASFERWDALVVDEAQDLDPAWVQPLLRLLSRPDEDPVLLLEDPAQSLFRQAKHRLGQPWTLDLSLRQHPALRRAACEAFPACGWAAAAGDECDGAIRRVASGPRTWREDLARELQILADEDMEPRQVIILAPHRAQTLGVEDGEVLGPWPANTIADWWDGPKEAQVRFGTVQGFKGLEADAVIYLAPGYGRPDAGPLAYTAFSRARHRLVVLEKALAEPPRPKVESAPAPAPPPMPAVPVLPQIRTLPQDQQARLLEALTAAKTWHARKKP